jgi:hypothetical protein
MTSTFARIRFRLPLDRRLNFDGPVLAFTRPSLPTEFELLSQGTEAIGNSDTLVIRSAPAPSSNEAKELGDRAQLASLIAAAQIRLGIDLGKDAPKSVWLAAGLEMIRQQAGLPAEAEILNDRLGLTLVDATRQTVFAGLGPVQAIVGTPIDLFVDAFAEGYSLAPSLTERSILALELFSASKFETSLRARFLTLVAAIECIADRAPRGASAIAFVKSVVEQLSHFQLDETDKAQLRGALKDLERRSISGSTRGLVEQHCGIERAKLFGKCYQARSELVHAGHTEFDLATNAHLLEALVADTIIGSVRAVA